MLFKAKRSQLVELVIGTNVTGNNQQVYFQNQPQLQTISNDKTIYIKGIRTYSTDDLISSPLSTNTVATPADITNAVLVLSVNGENAINMIPLVDMHIVQTNGGVTPWNRMPFHLFNVSLVDWTKSYVQVTTPPLATPFSYLFNVFYDYKPDIELGLSPAGELVYTF